jgi:diaminopimelate epimerase
LHNADGSIAEISGNGTRCVAAWMAEKLGSQPGDVLEIATDAGLRHCEINSVSSTGGFTVEVTTGMGVPTFAQRTVTLADGLAIAGVEVSTGNPHFCIVVDNAEFAVVGRSWTAIGAEICMHPDFPNQTNVEFLRIVSPRQIEIRIFERGVGPTSSSGTGSSASATAALAFNGCQSPLTVVAPGGAQTVTWNGPGTPLRLTGPAALIARGEAW